jgi:hypothetical protein
MAHEPDQAQQEARDEIARLYEQRYDNVVSEELSEEMLLDMLEDPETRALVLLAFPELEQRVRDMAAAD